MTSDLEARLPTVSLRVTRARPAVLAGRRGHPHLGAGRVIPPVRADHPAVSQQAVHEPLVGDDHRHVMCGSCGALAGVGRALGHSPCLTASDDHGLVVDEAEVVFRGRCTHCATEPSPQSSASSEGSR